MTAVSILVTYTFTCYFPLHLHFLLARAKYYFLGTDLPVASATSAATSAASLAADGSAYGLGVIGDYAYGGIEKLGEFVSVWKSWNGTAL